MRIQRWMIQSICVKHIDCLSGAPSTSGKVAQDDKGRWLVISKIRPIVAKKLGYLNQWDCLIFAARSRSSMDRIGVS